jgi:hypothetical protein
VNAFVLAVILNVVKDPEELHSPAPFGLFNRNTIRIALALE